MYQQAARELGVELRMFRACRAGRGVTADASRADGRDESLGELIDFATRCDVVTFDVSAFPRAQLDALAAAGTALHPNPRTVEVVGDLATTRRVLAECGFRLATSHRSPTAEPIDEPAVHGPASRHPPPHGTRCPQWCDHLVAVIARRPSGHHVSYPVLEASAHRRVAGSGAPRRSREVAERARAVTVAIAIANGIDATGVIAVDFVLESADGQPGIHDIVLGPHSRTHSTNRALRTQHRNHLRAILDWPLEPALQS